MLGKSEPKKIVSSKSASVKMVVKQSINTGSRHGD